MNNKEIRFIINLKNFDRLPDGDFKDYRIDYYYSTFRVRLFVWKGKTSYKKINNSEVGLEKKKIYDISKKEFKSITKHKPMFILKIESKRPIINNEELYLERVTILDKDIVFHTTEFEFSYNDDDSLTKEKWLSLLKLVPGIKDINELGEISLSSLCLKYYLTNEILLLREIDNEIIDEIRELYKCVFNANYSVKEITDLIKKDGSDFYYIKDNNKVIGFYRLHKYSKDNNSKRYDPGIYKITGKNNIISLSDLITTVKGTGDRLIKHIINIADLENRDLITTAWNKDLVSYYESKGFNLIGDINQKGRLLLLYGKVYSMESIMENW